MSSGTPSGVVRVRARLFAIQREVAGRREVLLELAAGATVDDGWNALVARVPALAAGRASVRFARNGEYVDPDALLVDGDELAVIPPVSGGDDDLRQQDERDGGPGSDGALRILELRTEPFDASILGELADRLATPHDGAVVGFLGRTRITPGTAAPGQETVAAQHAGRSVESLDYEAHESMAPRLLDQIADEIAERFGVTRLAIVHRVGTVPLGDVSVAVVAVAPHRDAAFDAARYGIDETKHRVPIRKAEQFEDGHVWIGEPARTGPTGGGGPDST
jgi:MoaE-MoaD fusion protein